MPSKTAVLLCRYKGVLHAASDSIADSYGSSSGILALNLGPVWSNADAYKLFGDNVIEISFKEWESPPGLGICPLDVIFSVCYSISSWLNLNADHVVVSDHFRSTLVAIVDGCAALICQIRGGCMLAAKFAKRQLKLVCSSYRQQSIRHKCFCMSAIPVSAVLCTL